MVTSVASTTGAPVVASAPDEAAAVMDTVRSFVLAFDEHDGKGFVDHLTDNFCTSGFGSPCDTLRATPADLFAGQPAIEIRSVAVPVIDNDSAGVDVVGRIQGGLHHVHVGLVRTAGKWLVDALEVDASPPVALPQDIPVVDVTLKEFSFTFDAKMLSSGVFALRVHNVGTVQHELVIKRVDTNAVLLGDAATLAIPVAGISAIDPGATSTVVLAEQLSPGHYFIFCEVSDGQGKTHLDHGMSAEFTVAAGQ